MRRGCIAGSLDLVGTRVGCSVWCSVVSLPVSYADYSRQQSSIHRLLRCILDNASTPGYPELEISPFNSHQLLASLMRKSQV